MKKNILMLVSNSCNPDPRVLMEAKLLIDLNFNVEILCWDRTGQLVDEVQDGITLTRVKLNSQYGSGMKQLKPMMVFWKSIYKKVTSGKYDYIHAHDFDTLIPSFFGAKRKRLPLIFDAHEIYAEMVNHHVPSYVTKGIQFVEKIIASKSNAVITVGERMKAYYTKLNTDTLVVGNYKGFIEAKEIAANRSEFRTKLNIPESALVIGYVGVFGEDRVLLPLIEAVKNTDKNIYLILGGKGAQEKQIEQLAVGTEKVKYVGYVASKDIEKYLAATDLIYYGLNANFNNNYYSTPNSLFNALAVNKPLLIGDVGEIAEITKKNELGYILENLNETEFENLFSKLSINEEYLQFVDNIESVKYNYSIKKNKDTLERIYSNLL